ncbi:DNA ligase (NAD(+)) (plasmid) [Thioalkalivibrio sp. K90mix]|uniref:BRCT domain-containing protein n=1 Tax=Thioalkalivibrio sp. (strain K90mix) TaxID=396595 RepID=UPI000195A448|nr:BRCT domain-containing protein [Thioalkalivibrio sp. K90mix]ADC73181.1 DNA ligase (NAD(+)) [Thioalkalivibrio sp. K90mix]
MNHELALESTVMDDTVELPTGFKHPRDCTVDELATACERLNASYRAGQPLVPDAVYDHLFIATLSEKDPEHPFLKAVEPEGEAFEGDTVKHDTPMLSTDKAYTEDELRRFLGRVEVAAEALGIRSETLTFRMTPKLDGIAGMQRPDGRLVTRGNGFAGADISHAFERGLRTPDGSMEPGPGELVLEEMFFQDEIRVAFGMPHPRNFVAGFVGADTVKPHHQKAADAQAIIFFPYRQLPAWQASAAVVMASWQERMEALRQAVPYRTDGVVLEVTDETVKAHMGSTSHHHRWRVALKTKGEVAHVRVRDIRIQTGRTGRITPVLEFDPVLLTGARISNVTAHTAANLAQQGLGVGAEIEISRAGDVIPKLERVLEPASEPMTVTHCPSCGHEAEVEGEYAVCPNTVGCLAQAEARLRHFFHVMGNADLFGPKTVEVLVENGHTDLRGLFDLNAVAFVSMGFGPGQASNLVRELARCLREAVPDWRFLAALGLRHLGRGDSRKLLAVYPLESITNLTAEDIAAVEGFGPITSASIAEQLQEQRERIEAMIRLGFNLERTPLAGEGAAAEGPLAGQSIVFTGTLTLGSRGELEEQARGLGATIQSGVNSKTTILVCGEKAGSKRKKAEAINEKAGKEQVRILDEAAWAAQMEGGK